VKDLARLNKVVFQKLKTPFFNQFQTSQPFNYKAHNFILCGFGQSGEGEESP
jgi:hypothetical protein